MKLQIFKPTPQGVMVIPDGGLWSSLPTFEESFEHLNYFSKDVYGTIHKMVADGKFPNGHVTVHDKLKFYDENNICFLQANVSLPNPVVICSVTNSTFRYGM